MWILPFFLYSCVRRVLPTAVRRQFRVDLADEPIRGVWCAPRHELIEVARGLRSHDLLERFSLKRELRHAIAHADHHGAGRNERRTVGDLAMPWEVLVSAGVIAMDVCIHQEADAPI
jgi:hypothetical protein